ncbi:hypothetical protein BYT27DRAFT_6772947 [Phlegmacium glaucopus]|nr:hypothetical protein BYT27DRAFT_6772947 [Phlegmacium glaucopus]
MERAMTPTLLLTAPLVHDVIVAVILPYRKRSAPTTFQPPFPHWATAAIVVLGFLTISSRIYPRFLHPPHPPHLEKKG